MNRNLKIPFFLLFLLASACFDEKDITSVQSESFLKYYNNYPVFTGADAKQTSGLGYALIGTVENTDGTTSICLIRTDEYGNLLDSARYFGRGRNAKAYCLQVLSDGDLAIMGSSLNQTSGKREVLFIRTNSAGDIEWTRTIASTGLNMEAKHFEVDDFGSFIMTGYTENSLPYTDKQVVVAALDKDGNPLFWSPRRMGINAKDDEGNHLQILSDGSYVITGTTWSDPSGISHPFIMKVNTSGGSPGIFALASTQNETGNCIRALDDNHFLVVGTVGSSSSVTGTDIMLQHVSLVDFALTSEWEKTFGSTGNDFGHCLLTENGEIQILGTTTTSGINTAISLIITDSQGNNPQYRTFGLGTQLSASSLENTTEGGFIISGTNKLSDNSISFTLIKTRSDGSM
ncbi:MAG: hypothetical protein JW830_04240 [Bacteroidales bacterium]|nr:hypothetical protein [Bacteroidales bacterium]